ncbi:MAG: hypothetical protein RIC55_36845 [Pirellulaceae bacterium]
MLDFEVQRCTRHCAETGREFAPGESYHSALIAEGGEVVRRDYCDAAWQGPPEGAIGWWKSQMPEPDAHKVHWAPNEVMLHYFEQLEGAAEKQDTRYILVLLMVRRRVLRLEQSEHDEAGREVLVVFCPRNETEYRVHVVTPDAKRVTEIQEELAQLLQTDAK